MLKDWLFSDSPTKISRNQIIEALRNTYKLKELINPPVSVPNNV